MKKISLLLLLFVLFVANSINAQIKIFPAGKVSIGTTDAPGSGYQNMLWGSTNFRQSNFDQTVIQLDALFEPRWGNTMITNTNDGWTKNYVTAHNGEHTFCVYGNGYVWAQKYTKWSDSTLKTQINILDNSLIKALQLNPVSYKYKKDVNDTSIYGGANAPLALGFLAQEVKLLFPELVDTNENGIMSLDYDGITTIAIGAIKDLDTKLGHMEYWKKDTLNNIGYKDGNVGIGTSEPAYTLDVKGNLNQYDTYLHEDSSITVAGIFSSAQEENIHLGLTISDTVLSKINFSNKSIDLHYMQGSLNTDFSVGKNGVIIAGSLEINNGTQNNGYVLTSDSFGLATWQPGAYNPWDTAGTNIIQKDTTFNIGIGTTTPTTKFDVEGGTYIHTKDSLETIRLQWGDKYDTLTAWNILQVQNDGVIIGANDNTQNVGSYIQAKSSGDIIINPITTRDIGNVGIGTFSPTARLHVYANYDAAIPTKAGYFYATGGSSANYGIHAYAAVSSGNYAAYLQGDAIITGTTYTPSDEKLKTNIRKVSNNTLDKINKLGVASYEFNTDMGAKHNFPQGLQIGIMAQDIEKQWPQLVRTDKHQQLANPKDSLAVPKFDEFKVVNYNGLIPILVKGIQELDATIDSLKALVAENAILKAENEDLKKDVAGIKDMLTKFGDDLQYCCFNQGTNQHTPIGDNSKLEQNNPNPFSENTTIRYYIAAQSKEAVIRISNLNGTALNTFKIDAKGAGQILLSGNSLTAGTYIYELIVDGKQIDAKRMVLTY